LEKYLEKILKKSRKNIQDSGLLRSGKFHGARFSVGPEEAFG
jgi:hypothetical protein